MPTPVVQSQHPQPPSVLATGEPAPAVGGPYAYYVLGVLFVVLVFNFIDRQILAILLQPIKEDLKISDTALGFLTGFAFAVFYTFAGIPLARVADRWVRREPRARAYIGMMSALLSLPFTATGLLLADQRLALLCFLPANMFGAMWLGPSGAIVQDLVPPPMRAMAAAIFIFILTIIGLGAGPQTVGILNDWIGTPDAIRYSLLGTVIVMDLCAALFFWLTGKTLAQDLEAKKRL